MSGRSRLPDPRKVAIVSSLFALAGPAVGQLILNEVLTDPPGSEHHEEFAELRNPSSTDSLDLAGWRIGDGDETDLIVDAGWGTVLAPGRLAVVLDASYFGNSTVYDSVRESARIVTIEDRSFGRGGWSNSSPERVVLHHPSGALIDSFEYDPADGLSGHSWERLPGELPAWQPSFLPGGTPGRANTVEQSAAAARQVEIEVSPDPFHDRLEILCRVPAAPALLEVTVFDAQGVPVRQLRDWEPSSLETRLVWDGSDDSGGQLAAGLYVILARASAAGRVISGKKVVVRRR